MKIIILFLSTFFLLSSCTPNKEIVDKIHFQADACLGECPIFTIAIDQNCIATYNAKKYNKRQGEFKTVLSKSEMDSLQLLVNKIDWSIIEDNYSTGKTDQPTYILTIKFKSGKVKHITDYGQSGPPALIKIYDWIFRIRHTQTWH